MGRNETKFWQMIKRGVEHIPDLTIDRIESGMTGRGIPDTNWCYKDGGEVWVELKVISRGNKVSISQNQIQWHKKRSALRSRTWIMVRDLQKDAILLYRGSDAETLADYGTKLEPYQKWERGNSRSFPWEGIVLVVFDIFAGF